MVPKWSLTTIPVQLLIYVTSSLCPLLSAINNNHYGGNNDYIQTNWFLGVLRKPQFRTYTKPVHLLAIMNTQDTTVQDSHKTYFSGDTPSYCTCCCYLRLCHQLSQEIVFHEKELSIIHQEGKAEIDRVLTQTPPPKDYAAKVEDLQEKVRDNSLGLAGPLWTSLLLQIVQRQDAISKEYQSRKGSVPLTVCHNLEQCLREVEVQCNNNRAAGNSRFTLVRMTKFNLLLGNVPSN